MRYVRLSEMINAFGFEVRTKNSTAGRIIGNINIVMLATSLSPDVYLSALS